MLSCPNPDCAAPVAPEDAFCGECGHRLSRGEESREDATQVEAELVCPRCGTAAGQTRYCGSCGLNLLEEDELPTAEEWRGRQRQVRRPGAPAGDKPQSAFS